MSTEMLLSIRTDETNKAEALEKVVLWITAFKPVEEMAAKLKHKPVFYTYIKQFRNCLMEIQQALEEECIEYPSKYCVTINQWDMTNFSFDVSMDTIGIKRHSYNFSANINLKILLTDGVKDEAALNRLLIFYTAILLIGSDEKNLSSESSRQVHPQYSPHIP